MSCDNLPTTAEIEQAKKDIIDFNTFMTSTSDTFVDSNGVSRSTLDGTIKKIDWSYVGKFADGVTFTDKTDFAVDAVGTQWIYTGSLPFSATAGTVPSEPTYQVVHVKSASAISNANGGSVQDFIDAQFSTVAELATGKFQVGQYVLLTDRAMGLFLLQSGSSHDGIFTLDAGDEKIATLVHGATVLLSQLGTPTSEDASGVLQVALDSSFHLDGEGNTYTCVGLIDSADLRKIKNLTLIKGANGTVLTSTGRAPQFSDVLIDGLNGFTGDNWVITGDNADLLNCGSRTGGGGLALRAEGNGTNIIGSKEAYQSVGQEFSIQIGNETAQTLYAKLTGVDTQTGGGIRWVKHGTASIVGGQIGGSTVEFGSYQIWHSDCRFNGDVILNGSGGIESSSISGDLTIGNGTNAISQVTISDDVIVQSGYTVTLNANVRESSINLAQIAEVGGVTIVDNLTGTANDVGNSIYLPPVAYSPNWTATTTQPSIGDGSLTGYYTRSGKTISVNITFAWGTTTNGGAGDWFFSVPKASGPYGNSVGSVLALDSGIGYSNGNAILPPSSSLVSQYVGPEPIAGRTRSNRPFIWEGGDDFKMSLSYQIN